MAPSPDEWTVLFRTDGSGGKLPSGKMGQKPKQVLVTVSGAASTFISAHHRRGRDGDVGDLGRRMFRAIDTRALSRESRNAGTGLAGGSGVLPGGLVKTKWPNPRKRMHLLACCAKAAHQTFAGIEMIAF